MQKLLHLRTLKNLKHQTFCPQCDWRRKEARQWPVDAPWFNNVPQNEKEPIREREWGRGVRGKEVCGVKN